MSVPPEVWSFGDVTILPTFQLNTLSHQMFASYSGPEDGLQTVEGDFESDDDISFDSVSVAGAMDWSIKSRKAYGLSLSLYDQHPIHRKLTGEPLADAFAVCARRNNALLVIADGVNWGDKSRMAARCAVYGCMKSIQQQLFQSERSPKDTTEIFSVLRHSLDFAQQTICEKNGGATTVCVCFIVPLLDHPTQQFAVCTVNVGDSLGFVFSKRWGIREITSGSHDIFVERDVRETTGALGPIMEDGSPVLYNLTYSLTLVELGDIVFLTTDGVSDNFDPVVMKIALPSADMSSSMPNGHSASSPSSPQATPAMQQQQPNSNDSPQHGTAVTSPHAPLSSASSDQTESQRRKRVQGRRNRPKSVPSANVLPNSGLIPAPGSSRLAVSAPLCNPAQPIDSSSSSTEKAKSANTKKPSKSWLQQLKFRKQQQQVSEQDLNDAESQPEKPMMKPHERHQYSIKEMERVVHQFELDTEINCSAQELCGALVQHVLLLTNARREVLEDPSIHRKMKKSERSRIETAIRSKIAQTPGKLDHASIVAYEVTLYSGPVDEMDDLEKCNGCPQ